MPKNVAGSEALLVRVCLSRLLCPQGAGTSWAESFLRSISGLPTGEVNILSGPRCKAFFGRLVPDGEKVP